MLAIVLEGDRMLNLLRSRVEVHIDTQRAQGRQVYPRPPPPRYPTRAGPPEYLRPLQDQTTRYPTRAGPPVRMAAVLLVEDPIPNARRAAR